MKQKEKPEIDFARVAKMDYQELLNEAVGDLKTDRVKYAYKNMKAIAIYNPDSKILDVKRGPLLGKYNKFLNKETKDKLLTNGKEINKEIQA